MQTDYRALLKAYMKHVMNIEGVSFVDYHSYWEPLSKEEKDELLVIEAEVRAE